MDPEMADLPSALGATSRLADVYAEALLGLADDEAAEGIAAELEALLAVIAKTEGFEQLLTGGMLSRRELSALVHRVFEGRCSETVLSFLAVLARRGRMNLLRRTTQRLRALLDARQGKVEVIATTAAPLDAEEKEHMRRAIAQTLGIEPILKFTVDEKLLGGLVLHVGNRLYDASAAARLRGLTRRLRGQITTPT